MEKPNVRHIEGLSPSIAIEQKKEEDEKILKDTEKDENIFRNIILLGTIIALLVHIYKYIKFER